MSLHDPYSADAARRPRRAALERLESRVLFAATPALLADVNLTTDYLAPRDMVTAGSVAYFAGRNSPEDGYELFRTDGTRAGTVMVRDIRPGVSGSDPQSLAVVGDKVFFSATDATNDRELYVSDGTEAGTVRVKDISTTGSSQPTKLAAGGSDVYFAAGSGGNTRLYRSDGTATGTVPVNQTSGLAITSVWGITGFDGGALVSAGGGATSLYYVKNGAVTGTLRGYEIQALAVLGNTAYFISGTGGGNPLAAGVVPGSLYRTDGTAAGTSLVKAVTGTQPRTGAMAASGGLLFFTSQPYTAPTNLWRSDGTEAGSFVISSGGDFAGTGFTPFGDHSVLFMRTTPGEGTEPWASDGTAAGTVLLADVTPGPDSGYVVPLTTLAFGADVYFTGKHDYWTTTNTNSDGRLWRSDGTAAGTTVARDFSATELVVRPLGVLNGAMLLNIGRRTDEGDLYRSDGTAPGTTRVGAATPGTGSGMWYSPSTLNGTATDLQDSPAFATGGGYTYYAASDGVSGKELWRTNTATGVTDRPADIAAGLDGSDPAYLTVMPDGTLYFAATSDTHGRELFRLARGAAAAQRITDAFPGPGGSFVSNLQAVGNLLYFQADAGGSGYGSSLWRHDPATGVTDQVRTTAGESLAVKTRLMRAGTAWYFGAWAVDATGSSPTGHELYRIDPASATAAAVLIREINPGAASAAAVPLGTVGNALFFQANNGTSGNELWRTDGTAAGTVMFADLSPGTGSTSFETAAGETQAQAAVTVDGVLYFGARTSANANALAWRTDGTTAGTYAIGGQVPNPRSFVAVDGRAYFLSADPAAAIASVYRTDGNDADGALRLTQPGSGDATFRAGHLYAAGGHVYTVNFAGAGTGNRYELWRTTGADAGTAGAFEAVAVLGSRSSSPASGLSNFFGQGKFAFASDERYLYFPMCDPAAGLEPHTLAIGAPLPAWLAPGSFATWDGGTKTLTVTGATTLSADPGPDAPLITATGPAAVLTIDPAGATTRVNVGGLALADGATATLADAAAERVLVVHAGGLNIGGTGSALDLADNALVVKGGPLAGVRSLITAGYAGGAWTGGGLRSSAAAADPTASLGYATAGQLGASSFLGVSGLTAADVVVRYTYFGDTNLDRLVNTDDVINILAAGKLDAGLAALWFEGDMTFDGLANTDDIIQILATGRLDQ